MLWINVATISLSFACAEGVTADIDAWIIKLEGRDPAQQIKAANELAGLMDALRDGTRLGAWPGMSEREIDEWNDRADRAEAAPSETKKAAARTIPALETLLHSPSIDVRMASAQALTYVHPRSRELASVLANCLLVDDPVQREKAARLLGDLGHRAKNAVPNLIRALSDQSADVAISAAYSLGDIGPDAKDAIPALERAFEDRRKGSTGAVPYGPPTVRDAAWSALHGIGPEAIPVVIPYLESKHFHDRCRALWVLSTGGAKAEGYVATIIRLLEDPKREVRCSAVDTLGDLAIKPEMALPALERMLTNDDANLRVRAVLALARFGPKAGSSVPALIEVLDHTDSTLRGFAAYALGEIGIAAQPAIPRLSLLLEDQGWVFNNNLVSDHGWADDVGSWAQTSVKKIEAAIKKTR